jgi:nucleoid-associated protein YgaU
VDVYHPKAGDTYEGISKSFYNESRYARALAAFNGNKALTGGGTVDVPPVHVLRQRFPQLTGTGGDTAPTLAATPVSAVDPAPAFRAAASKRFVVPTGGMTLAAVARQTLGSEARWQEVYDLNPRVSPNQVPGGTELRLPADATVP